MPLAGIGVNRKKDTNVVLERLQYKCPLSEAFFERNSDRAKLGKAVSDFPCDLILPSIIMISNIS